MKTIYNLKNMLMGALCLMTLAGGLTACDDLLEKNPPSAISDSNFWMTENDGYLALVGCYRFHDGWTNDDFATPLGLLYLDLCGGHGSEKENFTSTMAGSNALSTNSNITSYWRNSYSLIARYNNFLQNIGNCPMSSETLRTQWISEVKTLRAYYLFYLAFHFKNVPMPLANLTLEEANSIAQTPQAEVYSQIESDLKEAINNLPAEYDNAGYGRVTKGAASVLLSRVYLAQDRWSDAASILNTVISSGTYELDRRNGDDSYEKLFQVGGETSPEIIFTIQGVKDKYTTVRYVYQMPECLGGWHQFAVYNELVKAYFCADGKDIETSPLYDDNDPYANRDLRLYASVCLPPLGSFEGTKFDNGQIYNCYLGPSTSDSYNRYALFNGYSPKKGIDLSVDMWSTYTHTPLMRYAEVLLSYLEALNESNPSGVTQSVLDQTINDVRRRVNLPGYTMADLGSQDAVRQAVRKERRVELAFEGFRYFDVLRWGTASAELNHHFTGVKLSDDPSAPNYRGSGSTASPVDEDMYYQFEKRSWSAHNRYFPIPQTDMNINKSLVQNDGY